METTYTIAKIIKETPVQGKYGMQTRTAFTTNEEGEKVFSAFSNYPLKVGQQVTGEVIEKPQPDGRTFYNFNFAKKNIAPANMEPVMIELKKIHTEVYAIRQEQVMTRQLLQANGTIPTATVTASVPESTGTAFDDFDIAPEDIPFD